MNDDKNDHGDSWRKPRVDPERPPDEDAYWQKSFSERAHHNASRARRPPQGRIPWLSQWGSPAFLDDLWRRGAVRCGSCGRDWRPPGDVRELLKTSGGRLTCDSCLREHGYQELREPRDLFLAASIGIKPEIIAVRSGLRPASLHRNPGYPSGRDMFTLRCEDIVSRLHRIGWKNAAICTHTGISLRTVQRITAGDTSTKRAVEITAQLVELAAPFIRPNYYLVRQHLDYHALPPELRPTLSDRLRDERVFEDHYQHDLERSAMALSMTTEAARTFGAQLDRIELVDAMRAEADDDFRARYDTDRAWFVGELHQMRESVERLLRLYPGNADVEEAVSQFVDDLDSFA